MSMNFAFEVICSLFCQSVERDGNETKYYPLGFD